MSEDGSDDNAESGEMKFVTLFVRHEPHMERPRYEFGTSAIGGQCYNHAIRCGPRKPTLNHKTLCD